MEKEKKNNKGLIILVIVLILIILCLIGFIVYDKVLNNKSEKEDSVTKTSVVTKKEEIDENTAEKLLCEKKYNDDFVYSYVKKDVDLIFYLKNNDEIINTTIDNDYFELVVSSNNSNSYCEENTLNIEMFWEEENYRYFIMKINDKDNFLLYNEVIAYDISEDKYFTIVNLTPVVLSGWKNKDTYEILENYGTANNKIFTYSLPSDDSENTAEKNTYIFEKGKYTVTHEIIDNVECYAGAC